jgi:hypothetical protein
MRRESGQAAALVVAGGVCRGFVCWGRRGGVLRRRHRAGADVAAPPVLAGRRPARGDVRLRGPGLPAACRGTRRRNGHPLGDRTPTRGAGAERHGRLLSPVWRPRPRQSPGRLAARAARASGPRVGPGRTASAGVASWHAAARSLTVADVSGEAPLRQHLQDRRAAQSAHRGSGRGRVPRLVGTPARTLRGRLLRRWGVLLRRRRGGALPVAHGPRDGAGRRDGRRLGDGAGPGPDRGPRGG